MGYVQMQTVPINTQNSVVRAFEYKQELAAAGNGDWILIPDEIQNISVVAQGAGGATARVETTVSTYADVLDDVAIGIAWTAGEITVATTDVALPCTAIRLVQTGAGTSLLSVRVQ